MPQPKTDRPPPHPKVRAAQLSPAVIAPFPAISGKVIPQDNGQLG
jgi:hypothetical protein